MPAPHDLRQVRFLHAKAIYTALLLEGKKHLLRLLQELPLDKAEQQPLKMTSQLMNSWIKVSRGDEGFVARFPTLAHNNS